MTTKIEALRTPDERFADLPGYPFAPHYTELPGFDGLRMHYLDEGPRNAKELFLCLHGQPTWSYLYRKMIPVFVAAGARVIAPDLFGFGKSDKPVEESLYTVDFHRNSLLAFIEKLDLKNITLVCQDWGGLLGLTLPHAMPDRFARLVVMNTGFGTGDTPLTEGFLQWRAFNNRSPDMNIATLMKRSCGDVLSEAEAAAYAAPYPDARYKSGVRRFPNLVPDNPDAGGAATSREARAWFSTKWDKPTFMAIGMKDPVLGPPVMMHLKKLIKGCPEPMKIEQAGHFVQEWGEQVATAAVKAFGLAG